MTKRVPKSRRCCAWPLCENEAMFPAPCDPHNLNKRIYLCKEHISLYNKSWNGLKGFSSDEIFNMQQNPTWDKPTWELGKKQEFQEEIFSFTHGREKNFRGFDYLGEDFDLGDISNYKGSLTTLPEKALDAMRILGIEEPLEEKKIKKAYKKQVKEKHPDIVKDKVKAEIELKEVNSAYHYLKEYLKFKLHKLENN